MSGIELTKILCVSLFLFYSSLFYSIYLFCFILISFYSLIWGKVHGYVIPDPPLMCLAYVCTRVCLHTCLYCSYIDLNIKKSVQH